MVNGKRRSFLILAITAYIRMKRRTVFAFIKIHKPLKMSLQFTNSPIGRLRFMGIAEGISYVVLLFIAMPVKYIAGNPNLVLYTGWVHGLLFMLYILALISAKINLEWKFKKTMIAFLASLIPFGTFILDKSLRKEEIKLHTQKAAQLSKTMETV
jgi:integral membrane protein